MPYLKCISGLMGMPTCLARNKIGCVQAADEAPAAAAAPAHAGPVAASHSDAMQAATELDGLLK